MRLGCFLSVVSFVGPIVHPVLATLVCEECRPFDLQDAPGEILSFVLYSVLLMVFEVIGIDLTVDYGYDNISGQLSL